MFYEKLKKRIEKAQSRVCIGLDLDINKFPKHISKDKNGIINFCKSIVESTADLVAAYKINMAFYESMGKIAWEIIEEILTFIPDDIVSIADAKRGDISNTSEKYAIAFFEHLNFDSITVNPYMGYDSIEPFLRYGDKGVIILVLTSNTGSKNFQKLNLENGTKLFEEVAKSVISWHNKHKNCMMVVGATHFEEIEIIRRISSDIFFLVPGIGKQGGYLDNIIQKAGKNIIITSSRGIIFSDNSQEFAMRARDETIKLRNNINHLIESRI